MKEITSRKSGKVQIISDETWDDLVNRKWDKKYTVRTLEERKLKAPSIVPPEVKSHIEKPKFKKDNG